MNRAPSPRLVPLAVVLALVAVPVRAQNSPDPETRFSTGVMHLKDGRVDLALEEFKKAAKEDPKNPYFQKGLGLAYAAKRQWKDAIAAFRKALELNPFYVDVRNDLGAALLGSGEREAGKKEFLGAFSDPTNPTPEISAYNLGEAYLEEKNYPEAANWFRTSITRNKAYAEAYVALANALVSAGKVDEAVAPARAGREGGPERPRPRPRPRPGLLQGRPLRRGEVPAGRGGEEGPRGTRGTGGGRADPGPAAVERPLPYRRIIEALLERVPGARTALLLDAQGEVVVGAGDLGEQQRLIGAYEGIALGIAGRIAARFDLGPVRSLVWRHDGGAVVLATLKDGYYVVLSLGASVLVADAARHAEDARLCLEEEI